MKVRGRSLVAALVLAVILIAGFGARRELTSDGWAFAGADSYCYVGAASELYAHHRYAFRLPSWSPHSQANPPLGYCRPPGYSLFLAAVISQELGKVDESYSPVFARAIFAQQLLDILTCALVFLCARRLGGAWAGWLALLCAGLSPSLALFSASIQTETLATFLTTLTMALLLYVMDASAAALPKKKWALLAAGLLTALGMLVRPDGVLLLPCLIIPALLRAVPARAVLLSLLVFALAFSPWPLRNLVRFGAPHPTGELCDTRGQALRGAGLMSWFATWLAEESELPETLWCILRPECRASTADYPSWAFDTPAEQQTVERLLSWRNTEGVSPRVDEGFHALARERRWRHPLRSLVVLPARRLYHLWATPNIQPLSSSHRTPWPTVVEPLRSFLPALTVTTTLLGLLGLVVLWVRTRPAALLLTTAIIFRYGFLSMAGFVEVRYVVELLPVVLILGAVGVVAFTKMTVHALTAR